MLLAFVPYAEKIKSILFNRSNTEEPFPRNHRTSQEVSGAGGLLAGLFFCAETGQPEKSNEEKAESFAGKIPLSLERKRNRASLKA